MSWSSGPCWHCEADLDRLAQALGGKRVPLYRDTLTGYPGWMRWHDLPADDPRSLAWHTDSLCLYRDYYIDIFTGEKITGAAQDMLAGAADPEYQALTDEERGAWGDRYRTWYRKHCAWTKYMASNYGSAYN